MILHFIWIQNPSRGLSCSLCLTVDPFSPGGPGRPISPRSPWMQMSTTFCHLRRLVSSKRAHGWNRFFTFSPARPASPTGPTKPTRPWKGHNVRSAAWINAQKESEDLNGGGRGCLTLSPMGPTFPVIPVSPCKNTDHQSYLLFV